MFGFGKKKKKNMENIDLSSIKPDGSHIKMIEPRYEYDIKVFDEDGDGKPIVTIQSGVKANSDDELFSLYAMCQQKIQILKKREINPNAAAQNSTLTSPQLSQTQQSVSSTQFQPIIQQQPIPLPEPVKEVKPEVKYFSAGGLDFKIVGDDVFQKQWVRASEEDCKDIRIVNDSNNKIVSLKDKHIELRRWIKVVDESTDKVSE